MKLIRTLFLVTVITGPFHGICAAEVICIDEKEYKRVSEIYKDLLSKFDLPTVAQEFLDVSSATEDLKEQLTACKKGLSEVDLKRCDPLVKQYDGKRIELNALMRRFHLAIDMQEYLYTLKMKLERPLCGR